jgi:hypothetical protein
MRSRARSGTGWRVCLLPSEKKPIVGSFGPRANCWSDSAGNGPAIPAGVRSLQSAQAPRPRPLVILADTVTPLTLRHLSSDGSRLSRNAALEESTDD